MTRDLVKTGVEGLDDMEMEEFPGVGKAANLRASAADRAHRRQER